MGWQAIVGWYEITDGLLQAADRAGEKYIFWQRYGNIKDKHRGSGDFSCPFSIYVVVFLFKGHSLPK